MMNAAAAGGKANGVSANGKKAGTEKKAKKNGEQRPAINGGVPETPISSSVQDHFRGFTFQGESTLDEAMKSSVRDGNVFPEGEEGEEEWVEDDGDDGDDWEDEEPGGRYRKQAQGVPHFG